MNKAAKSDLPGIHGFSTNLFYEVPSELQTLETPLTSLFGGGGFYVTFYCSKAEICPFSSYNPKDAAWWRVLNAFESDLDADSKALDFQLLSAQKGIQHLRLGPYGG